jgi:cyclopropane fatty-acyl-phospholipid synthase-like methyltransferase
MNQYNPNFFMPSSLEHAKQIILTPEDQTVDDRWKLETEWTIKLLDSLFDLTPNSVVLDWGCGIGRLSKTIIEKFDCNVVGVDIEPKMLGYAVDYVNSSKFTTQSHTEFMQSNSTKKFTHCVAVWVFQHSNKLQFEIPTIHKSLTQNGKLFVVELDKKAIPSTEGYYDDGVPTRFVLERMFHPESLGKIPLKHTTKKIQSMSWWAILSNHE